MSANGPITEIQAVRAAFNLPQQMRHWCWPSFEFLGESDEKPFGPLDVAEPIRVFILDHFA